MKWEFIWKVKNEMEHSGTVLKSRGFPFICYFVKIMWLKQLLIIIFLFTRSIPHKHLGKAARMMDLCLVVWLSFFLTLPDWSDYISRGRRKAQTRFLYRIFHVLYIISCMRFNSINSIKASEFARFRTLWTKCLLKTPNSAVYRNHRVLLLLKAS